jgi:translation initiation factor 2B subunit (eIF-2B alpha/beta/delta family)
MNKEEFGQSINAIIKDKTSGSSFIANQIEKIFPFIPENIFASTIKKIMVIHSSMASVINRINYLCLEREHRKLSRTEVNGEKILRDFWNDNQNKKNWITLSMSHWVIECFKTNKKRLNLKVGISYPDREGLITFDSLKDVHNIEIYEDSRLCLEARESDGILLGADLITKDAVVNKTGSFPLAIAARFFKKPLYIVSSGDKFLSNDLLPFYRPKLKKRKSRLIHYFEPIPLELVSKIYLTTSISDYPLSETLRKMA